MRASLFAIAAMAVALTACGPSSRGGQGHAPTAPPTSSKPAPVGLRAPSDVAQPSPALHRAAANPCSTNHRAHFVLVSLLRQHMWLCAKNHIARDTAITSGRRGPYTETPSGKYHVQGLNRNSTLTLRSGATYPVKYWIPFDAPLFGFHDSAWQRFPYGSNLYQTRGSHGCIHMPLAAIRFLYHWAEIGTTVRIKA